ncbi:hypothetical protein FGLOB1_8194 [Fusarium globosum]|uniref:Uncharacterized protein n=1 Tax=Fusarium globosum TaxID=78864 RepID=A0A8H5Y3N0_9HYPO|nr:hypothetical protein FGLOB1_8194 [Fusarium globosum]
MTTSRDAKACPKEESPMGPSTPPYGNVTAAPTCPSKQVDVPRPWSGFGEAYRGLSASTPKRQGAETATASCNDSTFSESHMLHSWLHTDAAEEPFHAIKSVSEML